MPLIDRRWSPHQSGSPSKIWTGLPNEQLVHAGAFLSHFPSTTTFSYCPLLTDASVSLAIQIVGQNKNTPAHCKPFFLLGD